MRKFKILIVGAGIAGLTLAAFLKKNKNIQTEIIEKERDFSHIGFTIGIWDNGRQILKKLNKEKQFDKKGNRVKNYNLSDGKGNTMKLYHLEEFYKKFESAYTNIGRKELHEILLSAAKGISVKKGVIIESLKQNEENVSVSFSNGKRKAYDLVIGADGIHSSLRKEHFGKKYEHYIGWRCWFCRIDKKKELSEGVLEIIEPNCIVDIFDDKNKKLCMVVTAPEKYSLNENESNRIEILKKVTRKINYRVPEIIDSLDSKDVRPTDIGFVRLNNWVNGRIVLMGDAAHAMEPFAGIGASMAMEDAFVLSEELKNLNRKELKLILEDYQKRREKRIKIARNQTQDRWWWQHLKWKWLCKIRNSLAPYIPVRHFTHGYEKLLETQP